ncbi:MAG: CotH kinase family protein [Candidatus Riflebacteria bacterium]|nr:CotH kinase family protein [Candidatus Riflebacteria bacterium]
MAQFIPEHHGLPRMPPGSPANDYFPFVVNHFTVGLRPENYQFLFSDKPDSLYSFQDAEFVINRRPEIFRAGLRIRGTHAWNWDFSKPSFRLRLKGQKRVLGREILDFINPDDASMLANLISDHIAVELGMPSPRTKISTVTINNDYKGLYHLAEPINTKTLQAQGFSRCSVIEGNIRNSKLWDHLESWEFETPDSLDTDAPQNTLKRLLEAVKTPVNLDNIEKMAEVIDSERFAAWSALMTAIASIHTNDYFGHLLVFNHDSKRLFPVIADPSGFGVITSIAGMHEEIDIRVPLYEFLTPLLNAFFRFPEFQYQRNVLLFKILQAQLNPPRLHELASGFMNRLQPFFAAEPYASALINIPKVLFSRRIPVSPQTQHKDAQRLINFMKARRDYLLKELSTLDVELGTLVEEKTFAGRKYRPLTIRVKGHCPVEWDFSGFKGRILPDYDFDGIPETDAQEFSARQLFFPGLSEKGFSEPHWLMPGRRRANFILEPDFQTYLVMLSSDSFAECLAFLESQGKNAVTGERVAVRVVARDAESLVAVSPNPRSLHAWRNRKNVAN